MKPYYEETNSGITIYHGDCRDVLPGLADGSVDMVLTDPPYGIDGGAAFVRRGFEIERNDEAGWNALVPYGDWLPDASRLCVAGGSVAVFHSCGEVRAANDALESAGLVNWRRFYIIKSAPPPTPRPTFVSGVEECSIAVKPGDRRRWYGGGATVDRWIGNTPNRLRQGHGHPAEKPIAPIAIILRALCPPGGLVIDPFMGSGTTLRAAKDLGFRGIGIDVEERYCEIAAKRLQQSAMALEATA